MDIGTGKDLCEYSLSDGSTVPYHCIDIVDPSTIYTLYHYIRDCTAAFYDITSRGKPPIMAGGTGLYIEAFLKGYRIPNVPEDPNLRKDLMILEKEELARRLQRLDTDLYESTDISSKKRIVRSIEVALFARDNPLRWSNENAPRLKPLVIGINPPRSVLYQRIDRRLEQRLARGMVDEVRELTARGVGRERLALFGMEYKRIASYLFEEVCYDQMVELLRKDIHHLAKRQVTWFRGMTRRGIDIHWIEEPDLEIASRLIETHAPNC